MSPWKQDAVRNWSPRAFLVFVLALGAWEGSLLFQRTGFSRGPERSSDPARMARLRDDSPGAVPATVLAPEKALSAPRVRMGKPDGRGPLIAIHGSGWQPGETVSLELRDLSQPGAQQVFSATADGAGDIFNDQFAPEAGETRVTYLLTALGRSSGFRAQARFTDRPFPRKEPCAKSGEENEGPCLSKRQNRISRSSRPTVVGSLDPERFRFSGSGADTRTWRDRSSCP